MAEAKTLTLKKPIAFGTEKIESLTFRSPVAADFRQLPLNAQTVGDVLDLAGKLCGQPPAVINKLEGEDLMEVVNIAGGFIGDFLGIGPTP